MATKRPRFAGGAISEIYMGAITEETPTPSPPKKRKIKNVVHSKATAVPKEANKYKMATMIRVIFLPYFSAGIPPIKEPNTVPTKAMDTVTPCSNTLKFHNF